MENELQKLNRIKNISLNEIERGILRAHAVHTMKTTIVVNNSISSIFQRGVYHGLRIALSSFLFIIFTGGTVSAVADNALPGDPLYSFKLNVNEQVKEFFFKTPEEKVAYQKKRIENRVQEIQTLADSETLTKAKQETVKKALDSHIRDLSKDLNNLSPKDALTVTTNLEESLKVNKQNLTENENKKDALTIFNTTLQKVSDQEVKIISKELDSIVNGLSTTPSPSSSTTLNENKSQNSTPVGP